MSGCIPMPAKIMGSASTLLACTVREQDAHTTNLQKWDAPGTSFASKLSQQVPVMLSLLGFLAVLMPQLASAQTSSVPTPAPDLLDTELLKPDVKLAGRDIITANTISQTGITTPSLWWAKEQFGGKLINNWIAYQDKKRVDLIVNSQLWTLLDYIERYGFIHKLGTVARDYHYNLRVFNQQAAPVGSYTCNYSTTQPDCSIQILDTFGQDNLPVRQTPLGSN